MNRSQRAAAKKAAKLAALPVTAETTDPANATDLLPDGTDSVQAETPAETPEAPGATQAEPGAEQPAPAEDTIHQPSLEEAAAQRALSTAHAREIRLRNLSRTHREVRDLLDERDALKARLAELTSSTE